jgi:hypothetical protein
MLKLINPSLHRIAQVVDFVSQFVQFQEPSYMEKDHNNFHINHIEEINISFDLVALLMLFTFNFITL